MKLNRIVLGILVVMATISSMYAYDIKLCENMRDDENGFFFAVYWKGKCHRNTNLDAIQKAHISSDEPIQASRPTDKIFSSYSLVGDLRFPVTIDRFILKFGQPEGVQIATCDGCPGQIFQWRTGSARLRFYIDDYESKQPNYHADTRGGYLESNGKPIRSLYGVVINKDNYVTVRNKISKHIKCRKNIIPIDLGLDDPMYDPRNVPNGCEDGCSHVLRAYDPRHKLFAVFYFKKGILYKIWQGVFDITDAG